MDGFVTITPAAIEFFRRSLSSNKDYIGVHVDIISGGCQGMTYKIDFITEANPADLYLEKEGIAFYFASKAVLFISGMTIDYKLTPMGGSIVFENPNAVSRCSCGKSFCVDKNAACNGESCTSHLC